MQEECKEKCVDDCLCSLEGVLNTISKKWALLIINTLGNHQKLRYNEIMNELYTISPKTLSDLLKKLKKEGLIQRRTFNEIPPRVEYSLTENGKELRRAVIPIIKWASRRYGSYKEKCVENYRSIEAHKIKNI